MHYSRSKSEHFVFWAAITSLLLLAYTLHHFLFSPSSQSNPPFDLSKTSRILSPEQCAGQFKFYQAPSAADLLRIQHPSKGREELVLCNANFSGVKLEGADLRGADLRGSNLRNAELAKATFEPRLEYGTMNDVVGLFRVSSDLSGADLSGANLSNARLQSVNFTGARFARDSQSGRDTDLAGANLRDANMDSVIFEPRVDSLSSIEEIAQARNLSHMRYVDSPAALQNLLARFKREGFHLQEREITYAIKHTGRMYSGPLDSAFSLMMFESTTEWGMNSGRPLIILGWSILMFFPLYVVALHCTGAGGIWAVWNSDRVGARPQEAPVRVVYRFPFPPRHGDLRGPLMRIFRAVLIGVYFSIVSAAQIGWKDLNLGNWISRIQPREYQLRPTGWVRVVSGIQSVISVYLLALWVLTYFGNPFE